MFTSICILTELVAQSLGLLIAAGLKIIPGMISTALSMTILILSPGSIFISHAIPDYLQWTKYASFVYYGFEGMSLVVSGTIFFKLNFFHFRCHYIDIWYRSRGNRMFRLLLQVRKSKEFIGRNVNGVI